MPIDDDFAKYIASQWTTLAPTHEYQKAGRGNAPARRLDFESLGDAARKYEFDNADLQQTIDHILPLASRLQRALQIPAESCHSLHHTCLEILEWGGVAGTSSDWLRERCDANDLAGAINRAVLELTGCLSPMTLGIKSVFAPRPPRDNIPMNSALTKIFALAKPDDIVVYDGRVGAALGLLSRRFLEEPMGTAHKVAISKKGQNSVPRYLQWGWGDGETSNPKKGRRNPSAGNMRFPGIRRRTPVDRVHADYVWRASQLLKKVKCFLTSAGTAVTLVELERALFMVGYDVR
jgi:hypothetical protein